jgi:hypothetical protein
MGNHNVTDPDLDPTKKTGIQQDPITDSQLILSTFLRTIAVAPGLQCECNLLPLLPWLLS